MRLGCELDHTRRRLARPARTVILVRLTWGSSGIMAAIQVKSELTARVWKVEVEAGRTVAAGQSLMILESMKMEIPVFAPAAGRVARLLVQEADAVREGQVLAVIEPGAG
jgi:acetyl-CoA carboxylase biotin carboxyl carrier protein